MTITINQPAENMILIFVNC